MNQNQYQPNPGAYQPQQPVNKMDYTPISMWGYFGYEILFSIPLIGFICLLVFSFGGTRNINLRNFARSYFCVLIIVLIIVGIILTVGGGLAGISALIDF